MKINRDLTWWLAASVSMVIVGAQARGGDKKTFKGFIADSQCALNVHSVSQSHKEMIGMKPEIKNNTECVRYCVKERGGRFVLLAGDKVYKLDAQTLAQPLAGQKVKIVGTLDLKSGIISVQKIEAISADQDSPSTY